MSFRDEMNAILKTPEQIASEKRSASVEAARKHAQVDYDCVKRIIKEKCQNGEYKIVGNRRVISFDYPTRLSSYLEMTHVSYDRICEYGLKCIVKDAAGFDVYKNKLYLLSEEDDITIQLKYVFRDTNGSEQSFDIPWFQGILNNRTTIHIKGHSDIVLRCTFYI
ncbi:MAG: hypothetical protein IJZ42_07160 [Lachnospiraceae bacterium]|nr:hypothetical protein [Lachnospiraceae bacterium]